MLRNTWQAAHSYCSFLHPTQCAHTLHTLTNYSPLPGLVHWTDIKISALGSRVGWTPARKERTKERTRCLCNPVRHHARPFWGHDVYTAPYSEMLVSQFLDILTIFMLTQGHKITIMTSGTSLNDCCFYYMCYVYIVISKSKNTINIRKC